MEMPKRMMFPVMMLYCLAYMENSVYIVIILINDVVADGEGRTYPSSTLAFIAFGTI